MQQQELTEDICLRYVSMISTQSRQTEVFQKAYPYAIAAAVFWGFHYMFPGSRNRYTLSFRRHVLALVCELLLGYQLSLTTIQASQKHYFPDVQFELEAEEPVTRISRRPQAQKTLVTNDVAEMSLVHMESDRSIDREPSVSIQRIVQPLSTTSEDIRKRQQRGRFNAKQLSPLLQQFLELPSDSIQTPCFLKRTLPSRKCKVGGRDTFNRYAAGFFGIYS